MNSIAGFSSNTKTRRETFSVSLRRSEHDSRFANQRSKLIEEFRRTSTFDQSLKIETPEEALDFYAGYRNQLREAISGVNVSLALNALKNIGNMIAITEDVSQAPLSEFFHSELPLPIIQCLEMAEMTSNQEILRESIFILCNAMASAPKNVELLIQLGVLRLFAQILSNTRDAVLIRSIFRSLANMLSDNFEHSQYLAPYNLLEGFFAYLKANIQDVEIVRIGVWMCSNITRNCADLDPALVA